MRLHARRTVLYVLLPLASVLILGASHLHQQQKRCAGVEIVIRADSTQGFLDEGRVRSLINADNQLIDAPIGDIDLEAIENALRETNYVDRVDAYITSGGQVSVELNVRQPIARLMPQNGRNFYIDADQRIIPLSRRYSARTVLVTGHPLVRTEYGLLRIEELAPGLLDLLKRLNAAPALRAQVSEVYVDARGDVTLLPELGITTVYIGRADQDLAAKLTKLDQFYRQVAPRVGWNHYAHVNLSFRGQIVAQRTPVSLREREVAIAQAQQTEATEQAEASTAIAQETRRTLAQDTAHSQHTARVTRSTRPSAQGAQPEGNHSTATASRVRRVPPSDDAPQTQGNTAQVSRVRRVPTSEDALRAEQESTEQAAQADQPEPEQANPPAARITRARPRTSATRPAPRQGNGN